MTTPLLPPITAALACKLGSIAVHADELTSPLGHEFDAGAIRSLLSDPEVQKWLAEMAALSFVPLKRTKNER